MLRLPRLYPIIDRAMLEARGVGVQAFAEALRDAGVRLVQYRDKVGAPQEILRAATEIGEVFAGTGATLILNDRADLAMLAGWDGVHVGQDDLPVEDARRVIGAGKVVGLSTHREAQVMAAVRGSSSLEVASRRVAADGAAGPSTARFAEGANRFAQDDRLRGRGREGAEPDYIAIGPVFATSTKADAEEVVGLAGVRRARALTSKPLVAIGGITRENARSVIEAGADSVAVISALTVEGRSVAEVAREIMALLA